MKKNRFAAAYETKIILLDRDGTINEDSDDYIKSEHEWKPIPGSLEAIAKLSQSGFKIYIITNQSGIARGYFTLEDFNSMNQKMMKLLQKLGGKIDGIYFCAHHPSDQCHCRKPKTGLIEQLAKDINTNLKGSLFVGDSQSDLEAAENYGLTPALVLTGKGQKTLEKTNMSNLIYFENLYALTEKFLTKNT